MVDVDVVDLNRDGLSFVDRIGVLVGLRDVEADLLRL